MVVVGLALYCAPRRKTMKTSKLLLAAVVAAVMAAVLSARAEEAKTVSKSGIPYVADNDQTGPAEVVSAIRARRTGGKLLNLDRMLLHSPNYAKGWNGLLGAIRG